MDLLIFDFGFAKMLVKAKAPIWRRGFLKGLECELLIIHILGKTLISAQAEKGICL